MKKELINFPYLTKPISLYTLDNGHKVALAYKEGALVNISSWVKTGSINENDKNNGVSHFLEHLMFKGTEKYKAGEFDKTMETKGGIINAATWKDYTFYYITIPKKNLDIALEMHSDMMVNITLPEEEIGPAFDINGEIPESKRERYVVLEEIKMRQDDNWSKVYETLNDSMYENHPYKRKVIGTPEIISQVTREDIMEYYQTFYTPENMTTIIVGDFNHDEVLAKVEKEFDFKGRQNAPQNILEIDSPVQETKYIETTSNVNTAYAMFGWLGPKASNLRDTICLDLISIILGDGTSSRLYQNLIEKLPEPVFNMISSEHYQFKDGNNFFIQANFKPDKSCSR